MKKALAAWIWSLSAVGRSYRTVVVLAAVLALWVFGAYEWLGLPESSGLLLMLGLVWAIAQLLIAVVVVAGIATSAAVAVVAVELAAISFVRHRYMDTPFLAAAFLVVVGGVLVFLAGILIGSS